MWKGLLLLCILFFLIAFLSCKPTQIIRPMERYDVSDFEVEISTLHLPIRIDRQGLEVAINKQIGDVLYEEDRMEADGLEIKATKQENITLELADQILRYRVPLHLWIKKEMLLGNVQAEGLLVLNFKTAYQIQPNWNFETQTEVEGYEWLQKPVLKLGIVDLPIQFIGDMVLEKTKMTIAKAIDEQVQKSFNLQNEVRKVWKKLHDPVLISEVYKTWLQFRPQKLNMTHLKMERDTILSTIIVASKPVIHVGEKPQTLPAELLPNFEWVENEGTDFSLQLMTSISFEEAERLSRANMIGESYSYGSRSVTVEDVELYGQGNKLVINAKLSGSYTGQVYFIGEPKYNTRKNNIELEKVDFDFSSRRFLLKSAGWLLKAPLKKTIQENLNFYLDANLEEIKKTVQENFSNYEVTEGVVLHGNLTEVNVSKIAIAASGIKVQVGLEGEVEVDVQGFK